jgi:uncharacterized membrane protein
MAPYPHVPAYNGRVATYLRKTLPGTEHCHVASGSARSLVPFAKDDGARDDRQVSDDELESGPRATERLTFFSDAVVAIAMTLLAIDLPVPEGDTLSKFWISVEHDDGHYAAFLISFVVIATAWRGHHELFRYARNVDTRLVLLNMGWLLTIVLNPFATKLLVVSGQTVTTHALRFGFYALLQVLEWAVLYAMLRYTIARRLADVPGPAAHRITWQAFSLMTGFGLSIPVFFATTYAWLLWIASPLLAGLLRRRRRRIGPSSRQP